MIIEGGKVIQSRRYQHLECQCDTCGKSFMLQEPRARAQNVHFCNVQCFKYGTGKGSKFVEARRQTCLRRYGVESASQLPAIRERKSKIMKRLIAETDFTERREKSTLEKYGVRNVYQAAHIRQKVKDLYGSANPFETEHGKAKIKETMLARYGYVSLLQTPEGRKIVLSEKALAKRHESLKRNQRAQRSKIEGRFYEALVRLFGTDNVERGVRVNTWSIDLYLKHCDVYIQFDGVYYHGLDRPLEEIAKCKTRTDKVILRTYYRDIEQNKWFTENSKALLRITDIQYTEFGERDDLVLEFLNEWLGKRRQRAA